MVIQTMEPTDYQLAVTAFNDADAAYKGMEQFISGGQFLNEIVTSCLSSEDNRHSARFDLEKAQREWNTLWESLKTLLEDRNAKRKNAADALRQAVVLTQAQWKGPDGVPFKLECQNFSVSTKTARSFNAEDLLNLVNKRGLLESLLALKGRDSKGTEYSLVEQRWDVDYAGVKNWLQLNNLNDVLTGAYDERDDTPAVTGPKELSFLGETRKG